jgi:hypothetical protein
LDDERYPIAVNPEGQVCPPEGEAYPQKTPVYHENDGKALEIPVFLEPDSPPDYTSAAYSRTSTHAEAQLPRQKPKAWWKKPTSVLLMILILLVSIGISIGVSYVLLEHSKKPPPQKSYEHPPPSFPSGNITIMGQPSSSSGSNSTANALGDTLGNGTSIISEIANNTRNSVASSGLFLRDKRTWNMQSYWQGQDGSIKYQMSLDGATFDNATNVSLSIPAKVGSPISAAASTDNTGVVFVRLSSQFLD